MNNSSQNSDLILLTFFVISCSSNDKDEYEKYLDDNKGYHFLDDYLLDHEELWVEKIDNAKPLVVDGSEDYELRYYCEELKTGGHL